MTIGRTATRGGVKMTKEFGGLDRLGLFELFALGRDATEFLNGQDKQALAAFRNEIDFLDFALSTPIRRNGESIFLVELPAKNTRERDFTFGGRFHDCGRASPLPSTTTHCKPLAFRRVNTINGGLRGFLLGGNLASAECF